MTTDKPQTPEPIEGLETDALEEPLHAAEVEELEPMPESRQRAAISTHSMRILWMVIGGLTLLLIVSLLLNRSPQRVPLPAGDPDVAAMQADLERHRSEINRQRAELNLPPLAGGGEDVHAITARLRKDADTLVLLIERSQQLIAEKDRLLTEKNIELIRSEQIRESLASELASAQSNTAGSTQLEDDLSNALARANRLADELSDARKLIAELSEDTSSAEIETLKRQLNEAVRARDFFELRVQHLQATRQNGHETKSEEEED